MTTARDASAPFYISRRYALLWLGALLSFTGDMIFEFTLVVWIVNQFGDDGAWQISGVFVASLIPVILVGPIAGTLVDQWRDKVRVVVRSSLAIAVLTLVLLPLLADDVTGFELPTVALTFTLLAAVALISAINQFTRPATAVISRDIVPEAQRARAASLTQVAIGIAVLIGPPLAAPLFYSFGIEWALILNALSFVLAALLTRAAASGFTTAQPAAGDEPAEADVKSTRQQIAAVRSDLVAGLRMFRASPTLMTVLVGLVIAIGGFGLLNAISIYFVINNLGGSESIYGWFGAAEGAGTLAGAAVAGTVVSRMGSTRVFWASLVGLGVLLGIYSRQSSVEAGLVVIAILGFGFPFLNVALSPMMLRVTPRSYLGRVTGTINPVITAAQVSGVVVGGLLYQAIGPDRTADVGPVRLGALDGLLLASGLFSVLAGVYAWRRFATSAVREEMASGPAGDQPDPGSAPRQDTGTGLTAPLHPRADRPGDVAG
ncbi:MAG TPA: MFS transporter [Thermomicrobiales bacterium]|jgi:MFS family permease|nr:MFS transporter [Thermomicrobiales bacterium]